MTLPTTPSEPSERELHALYHEASDAEPGPLLDRRILAAAKADLLLDHKRSQRSAPWWKSLLIPATTIAIGVLGVSLTWRVVEQEERELRAITSQMEYGGDAVGEPAPAKAVTPPSTITQEKKEVRREATAVSPPEVPRSSPAQQEQAQGQVLDSERLAKPAPLAMSPPAPTAAPQPASELGESSVAGKAEMAAPAAKRRLDDRPNLQTNSAKAASDLADDGATPEAWLKHIRALQSAGREAEAMQSLARFRERYPDHALPADLLDLR